MQKRMAALVAILVATQAGGAVAQPRGSEA